MTFISDKPETKKGKLKGSEYIVDEALQCGLQKISLSVFK